MAKNQNNEVNVSREVKELMGREIIQRYYYEHGLISFTLRTDKELKTALEQLHKNQ